MVSRETLVASALNPTVWLAACPEQEALVCCARAKMDSQTVERLRELVVQGVNWEYLIWAAHRNRVAPLLYWSLYNIGADSVPFPIMDKLRHYFHINARHNLLRSRELLRILDQLKALDVACIPFKGPVLAISVYGQLSLRQFRDLDVLIDKWDVDTANDLLLSQGYAVMLPRRKHGIIRRHGARLTQGSPGYPNKGTDC